MYVQSVGIPFIIENDDKIKMFATDREIYSDFSKGFLELERVLKNQEVRKKILKIL